jgi:hypothetical protein
MPPKKQSSGQAVSGTVPAEAGKECGTSVEQGCDWGMEHLALILEDMVSRWLNLEAKTYLGKLWRSRSKVVEGERKFGKKASSILRIFAYANSASSAVVRATTMPRYPVTLYLLSVGAFYLPAAYEKVNIYISHKHQHPVPRPPPLCRGLLYMYSCKGSQSSLLRPYVWGLWSLPQ